jgi:hypothetical protein
MCTAAELLGERLVSKPDQKEKICHSRSLSVERALQRGAGMMTIPAMAAEEPGRHLAEDFRRLFGSSHLDEAERLDDIARVALECASPRLGHR